MSTFSSLRRVLQCGQAFLLFAGISATSLAQQSQPSAERWPTRPVRLLVGFPAGSSPDFIARAIAEPLSKALGQPVIVENRAGASGNIAAGLVTQSTDQHTLGVVINGNMTVAKLLNPATAYDPLKDLAPVSLICSAPLVLAAPSDLFKGTVREFLESARAARTTWNYGSPGVGTVGHLAMEVVKSTAAIAPTHVPYPSFQRVVMAMLAGDVQISLLQLGAAMPMVADKKLRAVGVTSAARSTLAPDFPTLAESGIPGVELEIWTGVAAPSTMPPEIVAKLSALLSKIARSDDVKRQLLSHGYEAVGLDAAAFGKRIQSDYQQLSRIILAQGIKLE